MANNTNAPADRREPYILQYWDSASSDWVRITGGDYPERLMDRADRERASGKHVGKNFRVWDVVTGTLYERSAAWHANQQKIEDARIEAEKYAKRMRANQARWLRERKAWVEKDNAENAAAWDRILQGGVSRLREFDIMDDIEKRVFVQTVLNVLDAADDADGYDDSPSYNHEKLIAGLLESGWIWDPKSDLPNSIPPATV